MTITIGYETKFKLGDSVKIVNENDLIVMIKAIRLDPIENSTGAAVLYLCGWFIGGIGYEQWLPHNMLIEK